MCRFCRVVDCIFEEVSALRGNVSVLDLESSCRQKVEER